MAIYATCKRLSKTSGVRHSVDHDIPLRGEFVWGLHVPNNLVIMTLEDNMRKGNVVDHQLLLL